MGMRDSGYGAAAPSPLAQRRWIVIATTVAYGLLIAAAPWVRLGN
jgi:hypothetical protein